MDTNETDKLIQEWIDKYRYEDGKLYYKKSRFKNKIGKEVKTFISHGYAYFSSHSKKRSIHRVIFAMFHRKLPKVIDHIDRNPLNNRIENLRESSYHLNQFNTKMYLTNKSGFRGVFWDKSRNKWRANICVQYKYINLGSFDTKEEAYAARVDYEKKLNIHHIINPDTYAIN
jgi:hypothetical protein